MYLHLLFTCLSTLLDMSALCYSKTRAKHQASPSKLENGEGLGWRWGEEGPADSPET